MGNSKQAIAKTILRQSLFWGGIAAIGAAVAGFGAVYGSWTRACAGGACPSIATLDQFRPVESSKIYAADGRLLADLGTDLRTVRALDEVTPALRAAFIASEDKRFYEHEGIDFKGIAPAFAANIRCLCFNRGFSTITMQLARNVFPDDLPRGKTIHRKVREMKVSLELERTYTKDRILEMYLNQIFLGRRFNGVEAAAQGYFGKSVSDLNVAEAATLAGLAPQPNAYDPGRHPDRAVRRRNVVINLLRDQGFLDSLEAEIWKAYPLELNSATRLEESGSYFVEWVRRELFQRFGQNLYERGYSVYTTLDPEMQAAAERALIQQIARIESGALGEFEHMTYDEYIALGGSSSSGNSPYLQGALVALDVNTGHVRAMVGGRDFNDSEFNRATQAERQPGSSFKAFVYTAAIRAGRPASYIVDDRPISVMQNDSMPWEPVNFEGNFLGPMTIRNGLRRSRNLVAILTGQELGIQAVRGEAIRFGLSTQIPEVESMFIGAASVIPIEMVSAYSTFATLGERATPIGILRVEDENGNIVLEPQVRRDRVIDRERAWILNSMFQGVVDRGSGANGVRNEAGFRHPAGGKTGTTNDGRDVWFLGFTSELVAGVWIGFDTPKKIMQRSSGGRLAAPVWGNFMRGVYERRPPPPDWERPETLITREVDNVTGYLATEYCPRVVRYFEWYVPGTEPKEFCPYHTHAADRATDLRR